jgi:hypothetical protein
MNISNIALERLKNAGWYDGRTIQLDGVKKLLVSRGFELFGSAENFLKQYGMLEISFPDPNPSFNITEFIHFNPEIAMGDAIEKDYFEELEDSIREKVVVLGETARRNMFLVVTPSEKYYGYTEGCIVKYGDSTIEALETICLPKTPKRI